MKASTPMTESDFRCWLSSLSHEIRNPLTLIYSSLQILEKEYPCVSDSPLWEQTKGDIQHLIRLLKDSSAAVREYQPCFSVFSVQELFQELILSTGALLDERNIQLDSCIVRNSSSRISADAADCDLFIRADRSRLKEALTNLLINAADAVSSLPDSHERRILLYADVPNAENPFPNESLRSCSSGQTESTDLSDQTIRLHVRDNGSGIPDEYLDTLFAPFVTHKSNGTGLGLSIVHNIARLHDGTVSVETNTNAESSFTDFCLCIPAGLSHCINSRFS